ncbi:MAG: hypothetical protein WBA42_09455 [Mesorhizobium sp.]
MADARTARPVSGEIMTGPAIGASSGETAAARAFRSISHDIVEADYEVVSQPAGRARAAQPAQAVAPTPSVEGMDMLRKPDGAPLRAEASRGSPIFWIAGIGAALAAFWVSGGDALVRQMPFFAAVQPGGAAFSISGVTSRVDVSSAKPLLFVDGEAANDGTSAAPLPPLEIKVATNDGRITRYTLGTAGHPLAPGERFAFSSRLDLPKNGVKTVSVVFAE